MPETTNPIPDARLPSTPPMAYAGLKPAPSIG